MAEPWCLSWPQSVPLEYSEGPQPGARRRRRVGWGCRSRGVSQRPSPMPFSLRVPCPPHPDWHLGHLLPRAPARSSFLPISRLGALKIDPSRQTPHKLMGLGTLAQRYRSAHRGHSESSTIPVALNFSPGRCAGLETVARALGYTFPTVLFSPVGDLGQSLHLANLSLPTDARAPRH